MGGGLLIALNLIGGVMGQKYYYKCTRCNYSVESSGDIDYGMMAVVKPYICNRCKKVVDVLIGKHGQVITEKDLKGEQKNKFYLCWKCNSRNITEWDPVNHPCPKCGSKMVTSKEVVMFWD